MLKSLWWETTAPTPADLGERLADLRDAIASQRLEGLTPSPSVVAQLERVARGERTIADVIADIHARIACGDV